VKETLIKLFTPQKGILLLTVFLFIFSLLSEGQCRKDFEFAFGGSGSDIAYDIVDAGNNQFYVVGTTNSFGSGGNDILILKIDANENIVWSKVYGGVNDEFIRKAKKTSDGGILVTGQTKSFGNSNGDILCFKVNADGSLAWTRKFGVGSPNGDLGMDIIETSDGGYAISGILNVQGVVADLVLIRLDNNANIIWNKRYDSNEGENGVGILQKSDTLIVSGDVDNNNSAFNGIIMKFNLNDGSYYSGKKIIPSNRHLFNSYVFKDLNNGYWISGHMIDGDSYAQMQQTILQLDNNFNVVQTYKLDLNNTYTNDFITGFIPLSNGFIACASPATNASGYIYQVDANGTIKFSKKISGSAERSFYRVEHIGNKLIAVGKDNTTGDNNLFVSILGDDGSLNASCNSDTALLSISNPVFTENDFTWPSVTDPVFSNTNIALPNSTVSVSRTDLCFIDTCINTVNAEFNIPDTVCTNTPVTIKNTTTGGSSFYWSFCDADLNSTPDAVNIGNPGGDLSLPVFMDIAKDDDGTYYGFIVNNAPGGLIRLNFGNSLLNTPVAENLGNFGDIIPTAAEGIQVIKSNGKWYAIITGGNQTTGARILKVDFGSTLSNPSPVATNWGNIGDLAYPVDLHIFNEQGNWYGFTVNAEKATLTRFVFGSDFINPPTGDNLGNPGNLAWPSGINAIKNNNKWYVFISNRDNSTLTRLDFGNSLLNTPSAINLGNLGSTLNQPRDISIIQLCNGIYGFAVNEQSNDIVKLSFGDNIESIPSAQSLGNTGAVAFPHSVSKLFRVGSDLYSFITNVSNNTITRLRFKGCTSSDIPNSVDSIPPPITYTKPGTYNIHLMVDEGLSTQTSVCKSIVVLPMPAKSPLQNLNVCSNDSIKLIAPVPNTNYSWSNGTKDSFIYVKTSGIYWVKEGYSMCAVKDSFNCIINPLPNVFLGDDTSFCTNNSILLDAGNSGATYFWQDGSPNQTYKADSSGIYKVVVTDTAGCSSSDSIAINLFPLPDVSTLSDTSTCSGSSITLTTSSTQGQKFSWSPSTGLSNSNIINPVASPSATTKYIVTATSAKGCTSKDSVTINVLSTPVVTTSADTLICIGSTTDISASSPNAVQYVWSPSTGLNNSSISNPVAFPNNSTTYLVKVTANNSCEAEDSVRVDVKQKPVFTINPTSAGICIGESIVFTATGGDTYQWYPAATVQNPNDASTKVFPSSNTTYKVVVTDNVCNITDSLFATVSLASLPNTTISKSNDVDCVIGEAKLTATGGAKYLWSPASSLSNPHMANPVATPTQTTMYYVQISNTNGCTAQDSIEVKVIVGEAENGYMLPTAFTPNNDGYNDCFGIKKWGYVTDLDFSVYNRWGNIIFHTNNSSNCWDGTYNNVQQPTGAYVYQIRAKTICGNVYRKGTIVLIR